MTSSPRTSRRLVEVDLNITKRCNLTCDFCSVLVEPVGSASDELSLEQIERLFGELEDLGTQRVRIVGGEPFVRRDIDEILRLSGQFRFGTSVLTNGTALKKRHLAAIEAGGVDFIAFSVDGHLAGLHDRSRGRSGVFDKLIRAVELCTEAGIRRRMMTAVTTGALPYLKEIVQLAERHRFEMLNLIVLGLSGRAIDNVEHFPTYRQWSEAIVDLTVQLRDHPPDVWVSILFPHEDRVPVELYRPLRDAGLLELLRSVWLIDPDAYDPSLEGRSRCEAGHDGVSILANGDVFGCDLMQGIPEFRAGNVHEQSLADIFHDSPVFRAFRDEPHVDTCGRFDDGSRDFSCGQCRAGIHNLQQGSSLVRLRR